VFTSIVVVSLFAFDLTAADKLLVGSDIGTFHTLRVLKRRTWLPILPLGAIIV
jgi:hypothetical protein